MEESRDSSIARRRGCELRTGGVLVLVSYVPLLRGAPGQLLAPDAVGSLLDTDAGHVDAIVWAIDDAGRFSPIFAMARAEEAFEHLVEWSEGSPATWFQLLYDYDENDDEYAMALVPNVQRSVDRSRLAHSLATGVEASHEEVRVVFQPLLFRVLTIAEIRRNSIGTGWGAETEEGVRQRSAGRPPCSLRHRLFLRLAGGEGRFGGGASNGAATCSC